MTSEEQEKMAEHLGDALSELARQTSRNLAAGKRIAELEQQLALAKKDVEQLTLRLEKAKAARETSRSAQPAWSRLTLCLHRKFALGWRRHVTPEGLRRWTAMRLGWFELKWWHQPPDGTARVRDVEAPCEFYEPGEPGSALGADCESDGHYLCRGNPGCRRYAPQSLRRSP